jgi:hypothetical protein
MTLTLASALRISANRTSPSIETDSGSWLVGVAGEGLDWSGVNLDEDALSGAHLSGVDDVANVPIRHQGETAGTARVVAGLSGLGDVGNAVLELDEDVVTMVDADAVAGTKVLVDPHSHDSV